MTVDPCVSIIKYFVNHVMTGTNFNTLHPANFDVRVRFANEEGLVCDCDYLGLSGYLPTEAIFERGCRLVHKAEAILYINQGNDGATPTFVEVQNQ
jgi:hypothetical protein